MHGLRDVALLAGGALDVALESLRLGLREATLLAGGALDEHLDSALFCASESVSLPLSLVLTVVPIEPLGRGGG